MSVSRNQSLEWHHFVAYEFIWPMMIGVATAYIIGPEFGRNPGYVQHCVDFCCQASEFRDLRGMFPETLRPLIWRFSRCGRDLQSTIASSKCQLMPEIRRRIASARAGKLAQSRHTLVDATIGIKMKKGEIGRDTALADEEKKVSGLAGDCLLSALEIAFPIAAYVVGMMNYAVAEPIYVDVLRKEIRSALHSTGGEWPIDILDRMPRLESFARETVRCDTTSVFTATRRLQKPVRLDSIGRTLDRGNFVAVPAQWLHQSPDIYPEPDSFDGCRFYDPDTNSCHPRAATGDSNFLPFGYGAEMCPGRGLGMRQAQLAFAKILISFDVDSYPVRGVKTFNRVVGAAVTLDRDLKLQWRRRNSS
ncbi:cytochrome P450 [Aspergillus alliaceus]|uniref:Cytochrome P450 n=1 Tax=Petromyces alliaceus TaxID=209559 RepID=A0A5N7C4P2_PETAA|nr:cytochrome P450 [Aspergillus alliaceus]